MVQLASALSLLHLNNYEGRDILESTFSSGYQDDRIEVVKALRLVDAQWAIAIIKLASNDPDASVRRAASA